MMNTVKIQVLKMKSAAFAFLTTTMLLACSPEGTQTESEAEDSATTSGQVILTEEQFQASGMQLGYFEENSFGKTIKINGTIDVPPEGRVDISSYYGGYVRQLSLLTGQK